MNKFIKKYTKGIKKSIDNTINNIQLEIYHGIGVSRKISIIGTVDDILSANLNKLSLQDCKNIRTYVSDYIKQKMQKENK